MAGLNFAFTADNKNFLSALQEIKTGINDISNEAQKGGASLDSLIEKVKGLAGISFAGIGLMGFANKVKETRAYFQDIESTMQVFLGSAEKAESFTNQLKDYAWYNMFDFADLADASKQLIAYKNDVNDVIPIIDKLSNIATATKAPLEEMVNLYNKAKSTGVVGSQYLASWAGKGVLIKETLQEMGEYVEGQTVSFKQLNMVLDKLTSEGGMFHGIMDAQMENISAEMGQLEDNFDAMLNEIGEQSQGMITFIVKTIASAIDNYKILGEGALAAMAVFGMYKGTMMASEFALKKAAEERTQAVVDGYNEQIKAIHDYETAQQEITDPNQLQAPKAIAKIERGEALDDTDVQELKAYTEKIRLLQEEREARDAVTESMQAELDKLRELNGEKDQPAQQKVYDADLQAHLDDGTASEDIIAQLQKERDIIREKAVLTAENLALADEEYQKAFANMDAAQSQVDIANERKNAADALVEKLQEEYDLLREEDMLNGGIDEYGEVIESVQSLAKAEELERAEKEASLRASELLEAQAQAESAALELNTADEQLNAAMEEAATASANRHALTEQQDTASIVANSAATKANTTATTTNTTAENANTSSDVANTAAQKQNALVTALNTTKTTALTVALHLKKAAVDAVTRGVNALKAAWATNPFGLILTAITAVVSAFKLFKDAQDEATEEMETYGEVAVKQKASADLLYAKLKTYGEDTEEYKNALKDLVQGMKDHNIHIDEEGNLLEQVNQNRERYIQLLLEEGRVQQLNKQAESYEAELGKISENTITNLSKQIKNDNSKEAKEYADALAAAVNGAFLTKEEQLSTLYEQIQQVQQDYSYEANLRSPFTDKAKELKEQLEKLKQDFSDIATEEAQNMAGNLGVDNLKIDTDELLKFYDTHEKKYKALEAQLNTLNKQAAEAQEKIDASKDEEPFNAETAGADELIEKILEASRLTDELNDKEAKPEVDASEVEFTIDETEAAKLGLDNLDATTASPTTDSTDIINFKNRTGDARSALVNFGNLKANPSVSTKSLEDFADMINKTWIGLQKLIGNDDAKPLININKSSGKTGTTSGKSNANTQIKSDGNESLNKIADDIRNAKSNTQIKTARSQLKRIIEEGNWGSKERERAIELDKEAQEREKKNNPQKSKSKKGSKGKKGESAEEKAQKQAQAQQRTIALLQQQAEEKAKLLQDYEFELWQDRIDLMDEGEAKVLEKMKFDHAKEMRQLDDLFDKEMDAEIKRQKALFDNEENQKKAKNKKYVSKVFNYGDDDFDTALGEYILLQKEIEGIKKKIEEPIDGELIDEKALNAEINRLKKKQEELKPHFGDIDASKMFDIGDRYIERLEYLKNKQSKDLNDMVDQATEAMNNYLKEYGSYEEKRQAIEDTYRAKIAEAKNDGERMQLYAQMYKDLSDVDFNQWSANGDFAMAFGDISKLSQDTIRELIAKMSAYRSEIIKTFDPEKIQLFDQALEALRMADLDFEFQWSDDNEILAAYKERLALEMEILNLESAQKEQEKEKLAIQMQYFQAQKEMAMVESLTPEEREQRGISQEDVDNLVNRVAELKVQFGMVSRSIETSGNRIKELKKQLETLKKVKFADIKRFSDQVKDALAICSEFANVFSEDVGGAIQSGVEKLGIMFDAFSTIASQLEILKKLGKKAVEDTAGAAEDIVKASGVAMQTTVTTTSSSMQALEKASAILAIIGAAIQLATMVASLINPDKKHQKNIEALQEKIDALKDSYEELDRAIQNAYSNDAKKLMEEQNKNLLEQQKLIQQQKAEEDAKKKTDKDQMNEYDQQLKDIERQIEENEKAMREAIIGKDIKSAISDFSSAYVEAFASGTKAAEASVSKTKDLLTSALTEMLNSKMKPAVEKFYERLYDAMADGILTDQELNELDALQAEIDAIAETERAQFEMIEERYKSLEEWQEELLDMSFDSLRDEFKNLMSNMESTTADFTNSFSEMLRNALIEGLMVSKYEAMLKEWYNKLSDYIGDENGLTDTERDELRTEWLQMAQDAMRDRDYIYDIVGGGAYEQKASEGSFEGMSQDTADELNGRFTALVELQATNNTLTADGNELTRKLLASIQSFSNSPLITDQSRDNSIILAIKDMMFLSTGYLEDVAKYTKNLETMTSEISEMKNAIQRI